MANRQILKNKYPILVAVVFFIYIVASAFVLIFASNVGAVMENKGKTIDLLPNVTNLTIEKDFTTVELDNDKMHEGALALVNNYYECKFDGDDTVSLLENFNDKYQVSDFDVSVNRGIVEHLNNMLGDFYGVTGNKNIMVCSGYRSKALQQKLYDEDQQKREKTNNTGDELVAVPGYSEHQTGYAVDFSSMVNGVSTELDNSGDFSWIYENSANYGFVMRYPENKVGITEIGYENWHYRYVGVPHSVYIKQNNLCLEEYISLVEKHSINSPLYVTQDNLTRWMVYFVPVGNGTTTAVYVPKQNSYQVSGDNVNGFIVSVKL